MFVKNCYWFLHANMGHLKVILLTAKRHLQRTPVLSIPTYPVYVKCWFWLMMVNPKCTTVTSKQFANEILNVYLVIVSIMRNDGDSLSFH